MFTCLSLAKETGTTNLLKKSLRSWLTQHNLPPNDMNISPLTIYLWQLADEVKTACGFVVAMLLVSIGVFFTLSLVAAAQADDEGLNLTKKTMKKLSFVSLALFVSGILTPSSKTIAMMVVIPEIAHSKVVQQDLPDIYNAAVEALKSQLKK